MFASRTFKELFSIALSIITQQGYQVPTYDMNVGDPMMPRGFVGPIIYYLKLPIESQLFYFD
jgi:hypothetical protein